MKKVRITRIKLTNFKGAKDIELNLDSDIINIYGANGTFKTTIVDAFNWLISDKDSHGNAKFNVKTLDENHDIIHKLDHIVEADLLVDDEEIQISKMHKEIWRTVKGKKDPVLKGNENTYYYNGVPLLAKDFSKKIEAIIPERIFKLMANTHAFTSLAWKDQRSILIDICGSVSQDEILSSLDNPADISKAFNQKKTLEEFKKEINSKTSAIKKDLKSIPVRISEVQRNMPESKNFEGLRLQGKNLTDEIQKLSDSKNDKSLRSQNFYDQKNKIVKQIQRTEDFILEKTRALRHDDNQALEYLESEINEIYSKKYNEDLLEAEQKLMSKMDQEERLQNSLKDLRSEYSEIFSRSFDPDLETVCPCCSQEIPSNILEDQKEELKEKFNLNKSKDLDKNRFKGKEKSELLTKVRDEIEELHLEVNSIKADKEKMGVTLKKLQTEKAEIIEDQKKNGQTSPEIESLKKEKTDLENELQKLIQDNESKEDPNIEIDAKIKRLELERDAIIKELNQEDEIIRSKKRILELEQKETELSNELISFEGIEFQIDEYERLENELLENKVNRNFDFVDFKLFHKQVDGGMKPTCEALINGVPYFEANTASRINAGIDIIETLSDFYQIECPLFIDNKESVTETLKRAGQTINLIVDPNCKSLKIK